MKTLTPWIVASNGMRVLLCEHCGERYEPTLPCSLTVILAILQAFKRDHRRCKARAKAS